MQFTKVKELRKLGNDYWKFWVASAVSMAASNILQFVLSLYVLEITGSATVFALMLSIVFVPRMLITPIAGVLADKVDRSRFMAKVLMAEGVILLAYTFLAGFFALNVAAIFVLVLGLEIGEVFYNACEGSIIPLLVHEDMLKDAIAVSKVDDGIVYVLSPMIAALIYSNVSMRVAFAFVMLLNLAAGFMQLTINTKHVSVVDKNGIHFLEDFKEGVGAISSNHKIRRLVVAMPLINAFFGATFSVSILYLIREVYDLSAYYYGMYNSVTAMTSIIIPVVVAPYISKYDPSRIFSISTRLIAAEIAGIGFIVILSLNGILAVIPAIVMIIILDCMTIAEAIPMQIAMSILIQTNVKKELLGRTTTTIGMMSMVSVALGELLFGYLADTYAVYISIFVGAIGIGTGSALYSLLKDNKKE